MPQVPTVWSVMGAALIIGCTLLLALIENKPGGPVTSHPETESLIDGQTTDGEDEGPR